MNRVWLVAEGNLIIRSMLKTMLTIWEVDSLVFEDGNQAWKWLDKVEQGDYVMPLPEVALLDIKMPGHLGYEIGRRMRAIAATSAIPLLITTSSYLSDQDKAQIHEAAYPEHLILKPFPAMAEFHSLIEDAIAGSSAARMRTVLSASTVARQSRAAV